MLGRQAAFVALPGSRINLFELRNEACGIIEPGAWQSADEFSFEQFTLRFGFSNTRCESNIGFCISHNGLGHADGLQQAGAQA